MKRSIEELGEQKTAAKVAEVEVLIVVFGARRQSRLHTQAS